MACPTIDAGNLCRLTNLRHNFLLAFLSDHKNLITFSIPFLNREAAMRFILFLCVVMLTVVSSASADTAPANQLPNPDAAQQAPAAAFVQNIGDLAIAAMADQSLTPEQRSRKYKDILQNSFDLETIGRFVLGRYWANATPDQQKRFMELYKQMILQTYGNRLNFYSGEKFQVKGVRQEDNRDSVVTSLVTHVDSTPPTTIDWRVRDRNGKLAVLDVVIEGVSQSVTQRQEYASIIQRNNGNVDSLIDFLQQKLQKS